MPGVSAERWRVEALGVAGSPAPGRLTTTFRLTGGILVDAGAAAHAIPPADRAQVREILLSHSHLDHTLGLPFLVGAGPMRIWGLEATLDAVRESLFDGRIWPDLKGHAEWRPLRLHESFPLGPWEVETGASSHTVPCLTYLFRGGGHTVAIVGDTRYDASVAEWVGSRAPTHCVVECSTPDAKRDETVRFGHQTPSDLRAWRRALGDGPRIFATHLKPSHEERTRDEIRALGDPRLSAPSCGDVLLG